MKGNKRSFKQDADESIERFFEAAIFQDIEEALRDSDAHRVVDNAVVRRQFGLAE